MQRLQTFIYFSHVSTFLFQRFHTSLDETRQVSVHI